MREHQGHIDVRVTHAERCLHAQHQSVSCGHCVKVCSVSAVSIVDGLPSIRRDSCFGCALCVAACPMDVFQAADWSEEWLADKVRALPAGDVFLACCDSPAAHPGVLRTRACLAAYSPAAWLGLCWDADVLLDVSECATCSVQRAKGVIESSANTVNLWLQECGRPYRIALQEEGSSECSSFARRKPLDGACGPRQFERGLLSGEYLFCGREEPDEKLAAASSGKPPFACRRRLDQVYTPLIQRQLQSLWRVADSEPSKGIMLPSLSVDVGLCRTCGTCFQYCPAGAIQHAVDEDGMLVFTFYPGRCADCGLCALSCSGAALARSYQLASPLDTVPVAFIEVKMCPECGAPMPRRDDVCLWCSNQNDMGSIIASARRFCGASGKGGGGT